MKCQAITTKGLQCKNKSVKDHEYCGMHTAIKQSIAKQALASTKTAAKQTIVPEWIIDQYCKDAWDQDEFNKHKNGFSDFDKDTQKAIIQDLLDLCSIQLYKKDKTKYVLIMFGLLMEKHELFNGKSFKRGVGNKLINFYFCESKIQETSKRISEILGININPQLSESDNELNLEVDYFYERLRNDKFKIKYDENGNIIEFDCSTNKLIIIPQKFIDTKLKHVQKLDCTNNKLTTLNVSSLTQLKYLLCGINKLHSLDVSTNTQLINLLCGHNKLSTLNLSSLTKLKILLCYNNKLENISLPLHQCLISRFVCDNNKLRNINLTSSSQLKEFKCFNNQLSTLNVNHMFKLEHLECQNNNISKLDLSHNLKLTKLDCSNNRNVLLQNQHLWKASQKLSRAFIEKREQRLARTYFDKWRSRTLKRKETLIYQCFEIIKINNVQVKQDDIPIELYNEYIQLFNNKYV
jgi:very-short-patch-repair endonuclease